MRQGLRRSGVDRVSIRVHFNQLALFTDDPVDSTAEETAEGASEGNEGTDSAGRRDPEALAGALPANGSGSGEGESPGSGSVRGAGEGRRPAVRTGVGEKDGLSGGVGFGDAGVGLTPERGPPADIPAIIREIEVRDITPEPGPPPRDFRITDAHRIGQGGLKEKARDNVAAIRTLRQVEDESRAATEAEKAVLARYSGWGALSNVFHPHPRSDWEEIARTVRQHLTPEEYDSARGSTPNAHFTSVPVVQAMWAALERLGLRAGAQILEPSMGVGHFFGLMPESLLPGCRRTGVELDTITARIAKQLYPDATIFAKGFEDTILPENFFDAVIGNIPFGNYPVHDPAYRNSPVTRTIHDYFLAKALDKLRPGGVVALITSRYTMDKQDSTMRRYLAARADLVGAIRLPNTAFKANAGTEVTTDILFFQKRMPGSPPSRQGGTASSEIAPSRERGEAWRDLSTIATPDGEIAVNEYFARHPEMMLGEMRLEGALYREREPTLAGELSPERLAQAVASLPEGIWARNTGPDRARPPPETGALADINRAEVKDGAYAVRDGLLAIRRGAVFEPAKVPRALAWRIRGLLAVRDAIRAVFQTQLDEAGEERIVEARRQLNGLYDSFVRSYGPLSSRENVKAFAGDPDQALLLSLETYDPDTKRAAKTAIFERRTLERYRPVAHVETAAEALAVSLNESGELHWPRMEQVTGRTARQLQRELGSLVYCNPEGGQWETADRYLSGDVRRKLTVAAAAAALDPAYERNEEALKAVQPTDLAPGEIAARLGSSWIPTSDIRDFVSELLGISSRDVLVGHAEAIATWTVGIDAAAKGTVSNTTTYGTARFRASELIEQALNGRVPTAYDETADGARLINQQETIAAREKQQQLKDRFREWIWEDSARAARLARAYNDRFNNLRLRGFDGAHLALPGMNREYLRDGDLARHQKDATWRVLQCGSTLLAHVVGAGKTWTMAAAAMELRRLGLAKKPMFVVPNHLVEQWGTEFLKLYPQARLFIAGKEHFATGNRQRAMARIASGTYDAVIVSHRSFEFLPVSDRLFKRFVEEQVEELEAAILEAKAGKDENRRLVKELEKAKKRFVAKLKERADREGKDNTLTFEELGVDQIFVDEADLYKNLFYTTKMNRIAGLPNSESNRALDMYMKTRYVREINAGRGVVFATGTPISNTIAEMYTMQRYLAPDLLKERGVAHFDAWAANFAEAVTALELAPDGSGYRMHTRFAKFINLPELLAMFRSFADVQTADMLNLPRPAVAGGKPQIAAASASEPLKAFIKTLTDRAERLRTARVDPSVDNMLKITGDGRKAALDMRLVDLSEQPDGETKLMLAAQRIKTVWEETRQVRSTQLVFCDLSTPDRSTANSGANSGRFNVYDELRARLIESGVPRAEIAFIHDADSDAEKKMLFDAVNAGRMRILIGSTEKMGAGTNVQRRLAALHHLDAPWRPRDIEQREGRILRQGNLNPEVRIFRYVTEGSFDAYMWQTLETKARFIQQVMNGQTSVRCAEDLDGGALTYAEIKAIASGNPAVMEKVKVDTEIRKLDQLRAAHLNQQHSVRLQIRSLPSEITERRERTETFSADMARRDAQGSDEFSISVGNRVYSGKGAREEGAAALTLAVLTCRDDLTLQVRGVFRGFEILSRGRGATLLAGTDEERLPELFIRGSGTYKVQLNAENPVGTMQSIEYALRGLNKAAAEEREQAARAEKMLADFQEQAGRPFEHEGRLKELLARQAELNAALDLDKGERQIAAPAVEDEGSVDQEATEAEGKARNPRRRREVNRGGPDSRVSDAAQERPSLAQKGSNPMTDRRM
jgi:N12 class adenine-specific DNA methylase